MSGVWKVILFVSSLVAMVTARHGHHNSRRPRTQHGRHWHHHNPHQLLEAAMSAHQQPWERVATDMDWLESDFHNPFLSSFFSVGPRPVDKPWWQGPNVCERKTEDLKNRTDSEDNILVHYTSTSQQCDLSESAYKCRLIEENVDGRREVTIVYECCHGYRRDMGEFGCPKRLELKNLIDTAKDMGLAEFLQAIKMLELTDSIKHGNFTVFAPVNGAFGLETDLITQNGRRVSTGNTKILQDAPEAFEVSEPSLDRTIEALQGAILGHLTPGALRSSALNDEQVLDTGDLEGSTIRINYFSRPAKLMTANCIPIVSRDNMATNGVVHSVEKALKPVTETLLDLVRTRQDLTLLKTVLAAAEYVPKLEEDGHLTLLAPTNGAFQKMSRRLRERLLSGDKKCIESVLMNHMLPNVICSAAFQKDSKTINLLNKYVHVARTDDGKMFVNDAQVVSKDIMALNGVMHIIDDVLIPEEALDFLDVLERKGLNELINLVEVSGLTATLQSAKNVTLFAPTNEAIQILSVGVKSRLISNADLLKQVLTYHVSPGSFNAMHFHHNQLLPSQEGRQIRLNRYASNPFYETTRTAQCAPIQGKATKTCNGNLHLISQVMTPPTGDVMDVLSADERFSTLAGYLKRADLVHLLSGEGPFTVLAPSNQAFDKMDKRSLENLLRNPDDLAIFLKAHVLTDTLCCAGFSRGSWFGANNILSASGAVHRVSLNRRGEPVVAHVRVVKCDTPAINGNILEMDQVLVRDQPRRRNPFRRYQGRSRFQHVFG